MCLRYQICIRIRPRFLSKQQIKGSQSCISTKQMKRQAKNCIFGFICSLISAKRVLITRILEPSNKFGNRVRSGYPVPAPNHSAGGRRNVTLCRVICSRKRFSFYSASAQLALQTAVLESSYSKSVRPSVCLSVCHTLALCQNNSSYDHAVFTVG